MAEVSSSSTGKAFCKVGEGWTCEITKTHGPSSGKAFLKCGEGCVCEIGPGTVEVTKEASGGEVVCECGEGWACVITKTDASKAGKPFAECEGEDCKCVPAPTSSCA